MTDMNHPNVVAGVLRETVALYSIGGEPFDPDNEKDQAWMTATYDFLMSLTARTPAESQIHAAFPGTTEVPQPPPMQPAPMPQAPAGVNPQTGEVYQPAPMPQAYPQQPVAPAPMPQQQYPQPMAAPAGTPPAPGYLHANSADDEMWAQFLQELTNQQFDRGGTKSWWDNRFDKKSEYQPDFRHRSIDAAPNSNGKVYKLGLFVKKAPPWALQILQHYPGKIGG